MGMEESGKQTRRENEQSGKSPELYSIVKCGNELTQV